MNKVVHKPWGKEEWLELNDAYCYKRIYINAGYKTSFQYHNFKKETNYIISGTAEVWLENDEGFVEKKIMKEGDFFNVTPPKKHRVIAITDIILQEVSTPHVDDVIRIDDEFNRGDGKIQAEHNTPAVLILSAGLGTRLDKLTKDINKAMIPINNKAVISHIIEKFPIEYEFVISLGYKSKELKEYCQLAHPDHKIIFVEVDKYEGEGTGPGYTALQCKSYLQRPFYIITADCILDCKIPHIDGNWLATNITSYPEKYTTIKIDGDNNVIELEYKNKKGFENAFIGLASIWDYDIFWKELDTNIKNGELVSAFENIKAYPSFKSKQLDWFDTGNIDDLIKTRQKFNDRPLSLHKNTGEILYKVSNLLKFNSNKQIISNKSDRAKILKGMIPSNFKNTEHFISYQWEPGKTLYEYDSTFLYESFLGTFLSNIKNAEYKNVESKLFDVFYKEKTNERVKAFINRFGENYYTQEFVINGKSCNNAESIISKFDITNFYQNPVYNLFHGDLQFANILYNSETKKFTYLDWRESFGGSTFGGDVYYDLAKLYGGCIIPYDKMIDEQFLRLEEGSSIINYDYSVSKSLKEFKNIYENWLISNGFDLNKVKLITALIFLNMSPLHEDKFSKLLWYKSIELLNEYYK